MTSDDYTKQVRRIALEDGRYSYRALIFVQQSVQFTVNTLGHVKREEHIRGQDLLQGIAAFAIKQFGPLAGCVLREWGIRKSLDFGHIVFLLVQHKLLRASEQDSLEDFADGLDFYTAFEKDYKPEGKAVELPKIA